jgi:hypothetical protein
MVISGLRAGGHVVSDDARIIARGMTGEGGGRVRCICALSASAGLAARGHFSGHESSVHAGETVRLLRSSLRTAAGGEFKVVHSLPDDGRETQYRIKSVRESHERVVKESDLRKD